MQAMANWEKNDEGHKVSDYANKADQLTVRLGDWNPNRRDPQEDFEEVTMEVDCVRIHPDADLDGTLANNVAVLILRKSGEVEQVLFRKNSGDLNNY